MFSLGDTVVYRHHVCIVRSVRTAYFEGKDYFELRTLYENDLKLYVAIDEAKPPALRPIMTEREALDLIDSIAGSDGIDETILESDAKTPTLLERRIKEEYERRLKTFSPQDLVPIIKSAHNRTERRESEGRRMTAMDKKYFELAENLLCDELAASLRTPRDHVRDFLVDRVKKAERKLGR